MYAATTAAPLMPWSLVGRGLEGGREGGREVGGDVTGTQGTWLVGLRAALPHPTQALLDRFSGQAGALRRPKAAAARSESLGRRAGLSR